MQIGAPTQSLNHSRAHRHLITLITSAILVSVVNDQKLKATHHIHCQHIRNELQRLVTKFEAPVLNKNNDFAYRIVTLIISFLPWLPLDNNVHNLQSGKFNNSTNL